MWDARLLREVARIVNKLAHLTAGEQLKFSQTMKLIASLGLVALCLIERGESVIPDYIKPCKASDPELGACIIRAINELRPQLIKGIPELDVPPMEPLHLDVIQLRRGIQCNVTNVEVWGPSSFEILEMRANTTINQFTFHIHLPFLQFTGQLELNSRIMVLNLEGSWPIYGNFSDYSFEGVLKGTRVEHNGEEYLKFEKMKLTIFLGRFAIGLDNLFNGSKALSRMADDVINNSQDLIMEQLRPALHDALGTYFTDMGNKITMRFTYKELFL